MLFFYTFENIVAKGKIPYNQLFPLPKSFLKGSAKSSSLEMVHDEYIMIIITYTFNQQAFICNVFKRLLHVAEKELKLRLCGR